MVQKSVTSLDGYHLFRSKVEYIQYQNNAISVAILSIYFLSLKRLVTLNYNEKNDLFMLL